MVVYRTACLGTRTWALNYLVFGGFILILGFWGIFGGSHVPLISYRISAVQ